MNAAQTKLLAEADRMSESTLIRMEDWQLAYLRVTMRRQVEETLNNELFAGDSNEPPSRTEPNAHAPASLVEAAR